MNLEAKMVQGETIFVISPPSSEIEDDKLTSFYFLLSHQILTLARYDVGEVKDNFYSNSGSSAAGRGCGAVGRAVASDIRDPRFKSVLDKVLFVKLKLNSIETTKIKKWPK